MLKLMEGRVVETKRNHRTVSGFLSVRGLISQRVFIHSDDARLLEHQTGGAFGWQERKPKRQLAFGQKIMFEITANDRGLRAQRWTFIHDYKEAMKWAAEHGLPEVIRNNAGGQR